MWGSMRNDGAGLAFHRLLGRHLDVEVDGELEVLSRHGERLAELADLLAVRVDDDVAAAVDAAQECVVGLLRRPDFPTTSPGW